MEESGQLIAVVVEHEEEEFCILSWMKKDRSLLADALDVMSVYVIDKKTRPLKRTGAKTAHEILVMDLDEYFEKW